MDNFYLRTDLDFPVYNKQVKGWFHTLLKIRRIPFKWIKAKDLPYMGFYRIKFCSSSEMFDFFFDMGSLFGNKETAE